MDTGRSNALPRARSAFLVLHRTALARRNAAMGAFREAFNKGNPTLLEPIMSVEVQVRNEASPEAARSCGIGCVSMLMYAPGHCQSTCFEKRLGGKCVGHPIYTTHCSTGAGTCRVPRRGSGRNIAASGDGQYHDRCGLNGLVWLE